VENVIIHLLVNLIHVSGGIIKLFLRA
jgi:hypothetical protein